MTDIEIVLAVLLLFSFLFIVYLSIEMNNKSHRVLHSPHHCQHLRKQRKVRGSCMWNFSNQPTGTMCTRRQTISHRLSPTKRFMS